MRFLAALGEQPELLQLLDDVHGADEPGAPPGTCETFLAFPSARLRVIDARSDRSRRAPRRDDHRHDPDWAIARGAVSFAHCSLQVESAAHDREHDPVHRTVHVDPPSQLMLPLGPTVTSHSEPPLQLTLHDEPQVPVHSF